MTFQILSGINRPQEIRTLFTEYTAAIIDGDPAFREYLALQNFDQELLHLEYKYAEPWGRLYLAYCDHELAGCIAMRRLDEKRCEMKRLYVRPKYRNLHLGHVLVKRLISDACTIGYEAILLDTFPFLDVAIGMYERMGFRYIEKYNDSPMESTIFMQLDLTSHDCK